MRLEDREVLARHAVNIRLFRLELEESSCRIWHDEVNDLLQVGEAIACGVLAPVVRIAFEEHALADVVAFDRERAGAIDLGWPRRNVPG